MHTLMTSEQPDKYAYCENENNQNVIFFSKIQNVSGLNFLTLFGYNFSCKGKLAFFKIVSSEKAKFKNQKNVKIGKFGNSAKI